MSIARVVSHAIRVLSISTMTWMSCAASAAGSSLAPQTIRPVSSPSVQFRQTVQAQQARDQLQKSQLQQQLHQDVTDNARRPGTNDQRARQQQDQADQAQHDRDHANDHAVLQREQDAAALSRNANGGG